MDDADYLRRRALARAAAMGEEILWEWTEHANDCDVEGPDCECLELYVARTLRWMVAVNYDDSCSCAMVC